MFQLAGIKTEATIFYGKKINLDKLKIQSINYIVMRVTDLQATVQFYTEILGMTHNEFYPPSGGLPRQCLNFGGQKSNLHNTESPFMPHARNPAVGSVDLCFISE